MTIPHEFHFLPPPHLVQDPEFVVDVGCNDGFSSLKMAGLWPRATVLAIEMDPAVASSAEHNTWSHDRIHVVNAAIGWPPRSEIARFHVETTHSMLKTAGATREGEPFWDRRVDVQSLDSVIERSFGKRDIDYLEMDIEGAEAEVLSGPCYWALRTRVVAVECHGVTECPDTPPSISFHSSGESCLVEQALESLGFTIVEGSFPFMVTGVRQ